jgi:hypothetical protein
MYFDVLVNGLKPVASHPGAVASKVCWNGLNGYFLTTGMRAREHPSHPKSDRRFRSKKRKVGGEMLIDEQSLTMFQMGISRRPTRNRAIYSERDYCNADSQCVDVSQEGNSGTGDAVFPV